jgi:hypothetical protein
MITFKNEDLFVEVRITTAERVAGCPVSARVLDETTFHGFVHTNELMKSHLKMKSHRVLKQSAESTKINGRIASLSGRLATERGECGLPATTAREHEDPVNDKTHQLSEHRRRHSQFWLCFRDAANQNQTTTQITPDELTTCARTPARKSGHRSLNISE